LLRPSPAVEKAGFLKGQRSLKKRLLSDYAAGDMNYLVTFYLIRLKTDSCFNSTTIQFISPNSGLLDNASVFTSSKLPKPSPERGSGRWPHRQCRIGITHPLFPQPIRNQI